MISVDIINLIFNCLLTVRFALKRARDWRPEPNDTYNLHKQYMLYKNTSSHLSIILKSIISDPLALSNFKQTLLNLNNMQTNKDGANLAKNAREQIDNLYQLSALLGAGLDKQTIGICVSLLESGVNPEALACIMKEIKKESVLLSADAAPAAESTRV